MCLSRFAGSTFLVLVLAVLAGCAPGPAVRRDGPAVEAPTYRVGDRWTYKASDGFRLPVTWDEVRSGLTEQFLFTETMARVQEYGDLMQA